MGSFNTLITEIACSNCGEKIQAQIQFKFGNTWQFKYEIGDTIKWGGNDMGHPNIPKVKLYGVIESGECPFCKQQALQENYDILVENDVIIGVNPTEDISDYVKINSEFMVLE